HEERQDERDDAERATGDARRRRGRVLRGRRGGIGLVGGRVGGRRRGGIGLLGGRRGGRRLRPVSGLGRNVGLRVLRVAHGRILSSRVCPSNARASPPRGATCTPCRGSAGACVDRVVRSLDDRDGGGDRLQPRQAG